MHLTGAMTINFELPENWEFPAVGLPSLRHSAAPVREKLEAAKTAATKISFARSTSSGPHFPYNQYQGHDYVASVGRRISSSSHPGDYNHWAILGMEAWNCMPAAPSKEAWSGMQAASS